jgi:7,8-dihydro-6-hydroxymethylpterin-pyrophosphokinase
MMHERWFVLKPLCDLDPRAMHPLLEMTVGELLKYVEQRTADGADSDAGLDRG